jgi:hypothetical protein
MDFAIVAREPKREGAYVSKGLYRMWSGSRANGGVIACAWGLCVWLWPSYLEGSGHTLRTHRRVLFHAPPEIQ